MDHWPFDQNDITVAELFPGFHGEFTYTDNVTVAVWDTKENATLQHRAHPHEQITIAPEDHFELTVSDETRVVEVGGVAVEKRGLTAI